MMRLSRHRAAWTLVASAAVVVVCLVAWYLVASARVVCLVACGGRAIPAGDVTVLVSEWYRGGLDAAYGGRLEVVGGCLGAGDWVIVWPHGTDVVEEDPLRIEVPDYGTFGLGDDVQVGGGVGLEHMPGDWLERFPGDVEPARVEVAGVPVPAECAKHNIWVANAP
jgi:hypothetical protein